MKLIECVPNFSEGRDRAVIDAIAAEIAATPGAVLLDVDPGAATNRTVVTFIGTPEAVEDAAFRAIKKAAATIDMARHRGEHPRLGATDVCPFVPVQGSTMVDCVAIARRLGKRVGEELGIPVYLYEAAATRPERRSLADIRKGEYEALAEKLKDPAFAPDFGQKWFTSLITSLSEVTYPKRTVGLFIIGGSNSWTCFILQYSRNFRSLSSRPWHRTRHLSRYGIKQ